MIVGPAIQLLLDGHHLSRADARELMGSIMDGEATPAQIAGFLVALRTKGETADEIAGFAEAMREHVVAGDARAARRSSTSSGPAATARGTFNISTAAAIVAAAAGAAVAKHGNRAASSGAGSADVLEELGIVLEQSPERIAHSIDELGFGFMFARAHHPAMRHVAPVRQELGIRTVFNVLGPLANPAGACDGVFGVYSAELAPTYAEALAELGSRRAFVVHGEGGLDELSPYGTNLVFEVVDGDVREWELDPRDLGIEPTDPAELRGGSAAENAATIRSVLAGERGGRRDAVLLNAAGSARRRRARGRSAARDSVSAARRSTRGPHGRLDALIAFSTAERLMGRFNDALATARPRRDRRDQAPLAVGRRPPTGRRSGLDRARLRRRRRGSDLGARRRAVRRHLGRSPGGQVPRRPRRSSQRGSSRPRSISRQRATPAPMPRCCSCAISTTPRSRG